MTRRPLPVRALGVAALLPIVLSSTGCAGDVSELTESSEAQSCRDLAAGWVSYFTTFRDAEGYDPAAREWLDDFQVAKTGVECAPGEHSEESCAAWAQVDLTEDEINRALMASMPEAEPGHMRTVMAITRECP